MRRIVLFLLSGSLSACALDSTGPASAYAGTWHLRSVNGQALPYDDGAGFVIVSNELTIRPDGSFSHDENATFNGQQIGRSFSGTCALRQPTQLVCTVTDGSELGFVWQGDSLFTASPGGFAGVYKR
jgi:hypothetical protein